MGPLAMGVVLASLGLADAAILTMRCLALRPSSRCATEEAAAARRATPAHPSSSAQPPARGLGGAPASGDLAREMPVVPRRELPLSSISTPISGSICDPPPYIRWNTPPTPPRATAAPTPPPWSPPRCSPTAVPPTADEAERREHVASGVRACVRGCCCAGAAHAKGRERCVRCTAWCYSCIALALLAACVATYDPKGAQWAEAHTPFYGVNMGGWLVTERWLNAPKDGRLHTRCGM